MLRRLTILALLATSVSLMAATPPTCDAGTSGVYGDILDQSGAPITDTVSVGWTNQTTGEADGDAGIGGEYALCLADGFSYELQFFADGYKVLTTEVVTAGTPQEVDVQLAPVPQLVGQVVSDATGLGLFTSVGVEQAGVGDDGEGTDAFGNFRLLVAPGEYVLSFGADGHYLEFYDDSYDRATATLITVTADDGIIDLGTIGLAPCRTNEICLGSPPGSSTGRPADAGRPESPGRPENPGRPASNGRP